MSREERTAKMQEIREAYTAKIKEILTEEQFAKYEEAQNSRGRAGGRGNSLASLNLTEDQQPLTECLADTVDRFLPYWHETIAPEIKAGQRVIIAAHGNSLRALVKYLDDVSDEAILKLNIPTGIPLVYELEEDLKPIKNYYLGDEEAVKAAMDAVASQGKAK